MISILLAAYNSEKLLEKVFLSSWIRNSSVPTELVIYDNGGNTTTNATGKLIDDLDTMREQCKILEVIHRRKLEINVLGDGKNIGLNAALNECAKAARCNFFYLPHTDMYLMPGWDVELLERTKNLPPPAYLMCSRSVEPTKGHTNYHVIKDYGKEWHEFKEKELLEDFKDYSEKSVVSGYRMPFFMHRKLWEKMGGVDPNYFSYCTDDDLVQTAYDVGVRRFWMVNGSLVYHLQGKSNAQQKVDKDSNKPYEYFIQKWSKRYPHASHPAVWHPSLIPWYVQV